MHRLPGRRLAAIIDRLRWLSAQKYGIEIRQVIGGGEKKTRAYTGKGKLINSPKFNGLDNISAKEKITSWLSKRKIG
ncbi:MAG: hypothetical protein VB875_11940, partial [Pirellulales bacterium]